jgi:hypothetical protein
LVTDTGKNGAFACASASAMGSVSVEASVISVFPAV